MISFCGLNCSKCPALIATRADDDEARRKTAQAWSKEFGAEIKPEDINCDGCVVADGRHIGHWDVCEIRKCGSERGLDNCSSCDDYACEKLSKFFEMVPDAKRTLDGLRE
jgi:hypothetical protein